MTARQAPPTPTTTDPSRGFRRFASINGDNGRVFTDAEFRFLDSRRQGRLVTIGQDDAAQVHAVAFTVDRAAGSVEIGGARLRETEAYRNARRDPRVSLVVEDPSSPLRGFPELQGRGVEIHGLAELSERSGGDVIRIRAVRLEQWNMDDEGHHSRFVS